MALEATSLLPTGLAGPFPLQFEVSPEFLVGIAGTILLMLLFLMVVVLWDIALALRDVAEKIDYLEDDVDSDLATINGTLTRIYDRMGGGGAGASGDGQRGGQAVGSTTRSVGSQPVDARGVDGGHRGVPGEAPVGVGGGSSVGARRNQGGNRGGGVGTGVHAATAGGAGVGSVESGDVQGATAASGDASQPAGEAGVANARRNVVTAPTAPDTGARGAADDAAADHAAEDVTTPAAAVDADVPRSSETATESDESGNASEATRDQEDAVLDDAQVDDEEDAVPDDAQVDDEDGDESTVGAKQEGETASGATVGPSAGEPSPDARSPNFERFATDGNGDTAWYDVRLELPSTARRADGTADDRGGVEPREDRNRTGTDPFGLNRPGLRSQLEASAAEASDTDDEDESVDAGGAGSDDDENPVSAMGREEIGETTVTDVATVSLDDLRGNHRTGTEDGAEKPIDDNAEESIADDGATRDESEERGNADGDPGDEAASEPVDDGGEETAASDGAVLGVEGDVTVPDVEDDVTVPDVEETVVSDVAAGSDADPVGSDGDVLGEDLGADNAGDSSSAGGAERDATEETTGEEATDEKTDDVGAGEKTVDDEAGEKTGDDGIATLVNRELDTLTQEVGGTSMTPDVADADLDAAVTELDDGSYTFPLSGSTFEVGASADAETATLTFTSDEPVDLGGARERLLTYQLRNYLDKDDTTHADLTVDGSTVVLDIPAANGQAVDAWADATVQIIDRTLYLSKDDD
jgi:hypothetical protein